MFAWQASDMRVVSRDISKHSLNVFQDVKPVKQYLCLFAKDRCNVIGEEISCLLATGFFIMEVYHLD